ncbi:hypothetical protein DFP72DRAFT_1168138 [Ephemerocybe angulata]|uniref:Uncharacterized protein n=1 Tax=Ephemerocybe angulata TaxID=980116 RepID=A0A8H6I2R8_9AGAR|nr:hypothetical protein DFP72DRAFT_1168138 [Tulosesus angulatus]
MLEVATCQEYSEALSNGYVPLDASAQKTEKPSEPLPSSLTSRIPHEMFDTIIAFESADRGALETFTLVSHAWDASSRHHLFSHFVISKDSLSFLANHLETAQKRILTSIRTVELACAGDSPTEFEEKTVHLEKVLPKMVNLRSLIVSWPSTPADVALTVRILKAEAWMKAVSFSDEVCFSSFRIFQDTVAKFAALEVLEVTSPSYLTESGDAPVQNDVPVPKNLRQVIAWDGPGPEGAIDILRWIAAAAGTIQSLDVGLLECRHLGILSKFIFLEHLSLAFMQTEDSSFAATNLGGVLSACKMLKTLEINSPKIYVTHPDHNPVIPPETTPSLSNSTHFSSYMDLLSSVSSQLSVLNVKLSIRSPEPPLYTFGIEPEMNWGMFNNLLRTSRSYAKLDELQIEVHGRSPFPDAECSRIAREGVEGLWPGARLTVTRCKL